MSITYLSFRREKFARPAIKLVLTLCLSAFSAPCLAEALPAVGPDLSAKYAIDARDPESSVPPASEALKNPLEMGYLLMDLIARAAAATERGDHKAAAAYYRAITKAVPERATGFSKLCQSYEASGDAERALASCREALGKGGVTADDYARYARLTLKQPLPLDAAKLEEVDAIVLHLREQLRDDPLGQVTAEVLACEIAGKLEDTLRLQACTERLMTLAPNDPRTTTFRWALALKQRDFAAAEKLLLAQATTLPNGVRAEMEAKLSALRSEDGALAEHAQQWALWLSIAFAVAAALWWFAPMRSARALG